MNNLVAVFDADGVFLRSVRPADYLEQRYGLTRDKMAPFLNEIRGCLTGQADMKEILPTFLQQWGVTESVDEFLDEAFNSGSDIDHKVAAIIATLRARGITCCLATNQDRHRMAHLDRHMRIREYFDRVYVSCEMGVKKPDHDFYDRVSKKWPGLKLVFWDDRPENVYAAEACGWTAYVFQDAATLETDINRLFGPV